MPSALANFDWVVFILFASFNLAFALICWVVYPETSQRTLEDLDQYFFDKETKVICCFNPLATDPERPRVFIDAEEERVAAGAEMRYSGKMAEGEVISELVDHSNGNRNIREKN
jgi:hypothetical protein